MVANDPHLTKAESDAQKIRRLEEQNVRQLKELREYIAAEEVLEAAGIVSKEQIEMAHGLVRKLS